MKDLDWLISKRLFSLCFLLVFFLPDLVSQKTAGKNSCSKMLLTLSEAIVYAQTCSPEAQAAEHTYRAAYWNYRSFKANYLPAVNLVSAPYLNRQINKVTQPDGSELFIRQNQLITDMGLTITQNLPLTGGNFFVETSAKRIDEFTMGKVI